MEVVAGTHIFKDFMTEGVAFELGSWYNVDTCSWRVGGVTGELVSNKEGGLRMCTADEYVAAGFGKCTSGVHGGSLMHDFLHLAWKNLNDVLPD